MKSHSRSNAKEVCQAFNANLKVSSGETITVTFIRVALALWKVLQHASVRDVLLLGDELFSKSNPISNSLCKLEALMQACSSDPSRFAALLTYMMDLILNGEMQSWECSWGPLTGKQQANNKGSLDWQLTEVLNFESEICFEMSVYGQWLSPQSIVAEAHARNDVQIVLAAQAPRACWAVPSSKRHGQAEASSDSIALKQLCPQSLICLNLKRLTPVREVFSTPVTRRAHLGGKPFERNQLKKQTDEVLDVSAAADINLMKSNLMKSVPSDLNLLRSSGQRAGWPCMDGPLVTEGAKDMPLHWGQADSLPNFNN